MTEAKTYTCPACGDQSLPDRMVRVKRWDGDYIEDWPQFCELCNGDGIVTLDDIVNRATEPLEYITRLINPPESSVAITSEDDDASDIPF